MTDNDRDQARPKVRVTDKRIRLDDDAEADETRGSPEEVVAQRAGGAPTESDDARAETTEGTRGSPEEVVAQRGGAERASSGGGPSVPNTDADEARAKASEYLEHLQRLKAEFDNYRKRVLKEQTRAVELATEPLMARLLEVLDEFELALVAAEQEPKFDKFVRGVEMVYAKLFDILRAEGLERIDAEGKPFDPERHEALLQADGEGDGDPYVADVLRTGYTLKGRVVRPAGVKVARR